MMTVVRTVVRTVRSEDGIVRTVRSEESSEDVNVPIHLKNELNEIVMLRICHYEFVRRVCVIHERVNM